MKGEMPSESHIPIPQQHPPAREPFNAERGYHSCPDGTAGWFPRTPAAAALSSFLTSGAGGLDREAPWPAYRHDDRNTGNAATIIRD